MKQKQVDSWGLLVSQPSLLGEPKGAVTNRNKQTKKVTVSKEAPQAVSDLHTHSMHTLE